MWIGLEPIRSLTDLAAHHFLDALPNAGGGLNPGHAGTEYGTYQGIERDFGAVTWTGHAWPPGESKKRWSDTSKLLRITAIFYSSIPLL
jgi:hypothetical protein